MGKTELAKQLASYTNGTYSTTLYAEVAIADAEADSNFVHIDMNEYQESYTLGRLTGKNLSFVVEMSLIDHRRCFC